MKNFIFLLPLVLGFSAFADTGGMSFQLLSEARKTITLPELSREDKLLILDQTKLILRDVFVHRDLKIQNYGPEADPLPNLEIIRSQVEKLSTPAFHQEMYKAFQRMHDWHTTFQMPKPYSCYRTILPLGFKSVRDEFGSTVVGVDSVSARPEILKLLPPGLKLSPGEILIKYNQEPIQKVLRRNEARAYGANPAAIKRDGVLFLSIASQKTGPFPANDEVTLTLVDKEGVERDVTVPWIVRGDLKCLAPPAPNTGDVKAMIGEKEIQNDFNDIVRVKRKSSLKGPADLIDSQDPILKYKIIKNEFGTFGYLRLDSFVPEKLNSEQFVREIKRILDGPLAVTDGLIVDLRGNGGGFIWIGEAMVQLLNHRNSVPMNFVLKNSAANRHFWNTWAPLDEFNLDLIRAETEGLPYTKGLPLNSAKSLNSLGQSHMKSVAVFINASCYSTCDMFSAAMQDLGAGIIVGEDPNTGAGGANNWNHQMIMNNLKRDPGPFKQLPGGINIGFSFRQTIRTGIHAGEVIEDVGVRADMVVEATIGDLDTSEYQLRSITKKLATEASKFTSWARVENQSNDIRIGKPASIFMKWENTSEIDVLINGIPKGTLNIDPSAPQGKEIQIPFVDTNEPRSAQIELLGKQNGNRVWRKIVNFRTVPETTILYSGLTTDFESGIAPYLIYNESTNAQDGWRLENGKLRVGSGASYVANVTSKLSLMARLDNVSKLQFNAQVDSEENYDAILVNIYVGGVKENLSYISGKVSETLYEIDLSKYKGKEVELEFEFESDGMTEGGLVTLDNIIIK